MRNFKRAIALAVLAALLAGTYGVYQRLTPSPEETGVGETVAVQRGNLVLTAAAFGSISLPQKVTLSFPTAGTIAGVEVEVGDQVTQGQVLARLDDGPLRQAVLQAQVGLRNAELALNDVKEPYSEEDIARQKDAVAEAGRAVSLAELEVPLARATGERSVADAQEALDEVLAPYSEDDIAAAREAVAEAQRALQLARQDVPIVRTTGERSVADAQEALDLELDSYGEVMLRYLDEELSDEELLVDPNVYFPWVTELPKSLADAYEELIKVKEKLDLARLQADKSLQAAQSAVAKAEETLRAAQVRLADMVPDSQEVEAAQRNLELARLQAEKSLQSAQNSAAKARESLRAARDRLAEMEAGAEPEEVGLKELQVSQARFTLEEAEADLEAALLLAPFAGVVGEVRAEAGDRVAAGAPVVVVVDPSQVEVSATVDEVDVARVRVGQPAVITLDALPGERLRGRVKSISPVAQVQSGVVSYPVVISVLRGGKAVQGGTATPGGQPRQPTAAPGGPSRAGTATEIQPREGMSASIEIVVEMKRDVLLLPSRAVRSVEGRRVVSVPGVGGAEERTVEVGLTNGRSTEITSGLHEGDTVVLPASAGVTTSPGGRRIVPVPGGRRMFR